MLAAPSVYLKTTLEPLDRAAFGDKFVDLGDQRDRARRAGRRWPSTSTAGTACRSDQLGIVSGPCHAEEVALERLSYLTAVCKDARKRAQRSGEKIGTPYISVGSFDRHLRHRICVRAQEHLRDGGRDRGRAGLRGQSSWPC